MRLPHPPLLKKPVQAGRSGSLCKPCIARGLLCGGGGQGDPQPWDWYPLQTQKRPFWLLPYHPSFPLPLPLCCFHEEFSCPAQHILPGTNEETRSERDTCTSMFITALFKIARTWKQPRCPSADECIRKLWSIYTMEYYSAMKNDTFESVLRRWMKLEFIIQSEVSQKGKYQYTILTCIYGI